MTALLLALHTPALAELCEADVPLIGDLQEAVAARPEVIHTPEQDRALLSEAFETILQGESTGWGIRDSYMVCYEQVEHMNRRLAELLPELVERYDFVMEDNMALRSLGTGRVEMSSDARAGAFTDHPAPTDHTSQHPDRDHHFFIAYSKYVQYISKHHSSRIVPC